MVKDRSGRRRHGRAGVPPVRFARGSDAELARRRRCCARSAPAHGCGRRRRGLRRPFVTARFVTNAAKKKVPIEKIKRVTGQRSNSIVLDYVAAATLDDDPPLLEIVARCDALL